MSGSARLSEYRLKRRVQFYETDMAGIVHFSWFFRYMEEAEHALWRAAGLSIAPPDSAIGWPRVNDWLFWKISDWMAAAVVEPLMLTVPKSVKLLPVKVLVPLRLTVPTPRLIEATERLGAVDVLVNGERRSIWMAFIGNGTYHDAGIAPGWRHSLNDGTLDVRFLDAGRHRSRVRAVAALLLGERVGRAAAEDICLTGRIVRGDLDHPELIPANVDLVIEKGDLRAQRMLEAGDVLFVPKTRITSWNAFLNEKYWTWLWHRQKPGKDVSRWCMAKRGLAKHRSWSISSMNIK